MGRGWIRLALMPVTLPGAALGIVYMLVTRRHPSPQMLMLLGVVGLAAIGWAISVLTHS